MSFKRLKYNAWKNIEAQMKDTVSYYAKNDLSPFTLAVDSTHMTDFAIFDFPTMLRELRAAIEKDTEGKYFGKVELKTLEDAIKLYRCLDKIGTWEEKLKIMDVVISNKKVPVYLGGILNDISNADVMDLFVNYIDYINDITFYSPEVSNVFEKLVSLPPMNTDIVYEPYIDSTLTEYKTPQDWIHTVSMNSFRTYITDSMRRGMPKINSIIEELSADGVNELDSPYVNLRSFIDIISEYQFPIGYFMQEPAFNKIYRVKNDDYKHNPYHLVQTHHVNRRCIQDILCNIVDTLNCINDNKNACGSFSLKERIDMLNYYGIRFDVETTCIKLDTTNMKSRRLRGFSDITECKEMVTSSFQLLLDLRSIEGLLFASLSEDSNGNCSLQLLTQSAFLFLMKIYVKYALYVMEPHFAESISTYNFDVKTVALFPLLFECFRKFYKNQANIYRNLSYVIHPTDFANQFIQAYERSSGYDYEHNLQKISNVFSLLKTWFPLKKSTVVTNNTNSVSDYKLISQFIFFGCCEHRANKISGQMVIPKIDPSHTLLMLRTEIPSSEDLRNIAHIVNINTTACEIIRDTLYKITNNNIKFKNALYSMNSYLPACYVMPKSGGIWSPIAEPEIIPFLAYLSGIVVKNQKKDYDSPVVISEGNVNDPD